MFNYIISSRKLWYVHVTGRNGEECVCVFLSLAMTLARICSSMLCDMQKLHTNYLFDYNWWPNESGNSYFWCSFFTPFLTLWLNPLMWNLFTLEFKFAMSSWLPENFLHSIVASIFLSLSSLSSLSSLILVVCVCA